MNTLNRTLLAGMLAALVCSSVAAAERDGQGSEEWRNASPEQRATMMTERMVERLQLDDSQASSVTGINRRYAEEAATLRQLEREERQPRMRELNSRKRDELSKILSEAQMSQLDQAAQLMRKRQQKKTRQRKQQQTAEDEG